MGESPREAAGAPAPGHPRFSGSHCRGRCRGRGAGEQGTQQRPPGPVPDRSCTPSPWTCPELRLTSQGGGGWEGTGPLNKIPFIFKKLKNNADIIPSALRPASGSHLAPSCPRKRGDDALAQARAEEAAATSPSTRYKNIHIKRGGACWAERQGSGAFVRRGEALAGAWVGASRRAPSSYPAVPSQRPARPRAPTTVALRGRARAHWPEVSQRPWGTVTAQETGPVPPALRMQRQGQRGQPGGAGPGPGRGGQEAAMAVPPPSLTIICWQSLQERRSPTFSRVRAASASSTARWPGDERKERGRWRQASRMAVARSR